MNDSFLLLIISIPRLIVGIALQDRFEEYPKLRELICLKDEYIHKTNTLPMYLRCDLLAPNFTLSSLDCEFDVILIEPPLEEYKRTNGIHFDRYVTWDEVNILLK